MIRRVADATTLRIGGTPHAWHEATTRDQLLNALRACPVESTVLVGGGSNIVCADDFSAWTVIAVRTSGVEVFDADDAVLMVCEAGEDWNEFVSTAVSQGLSGISALAGIPGTVGATPVQNIGAYGCEVSDVIDHVVVWDRSRDDVVTLHKDACGFEYRSSLFKKDPSRYVVLAVAFVLSADGTEIVRYPALAEYMGVEVGAVVPVEDIRRGVLELRAQRGMVLDAHDHDTWSVGSFFVNPIVSSEQAAQLPDACPRYPASKGIKLSAAWLIENAGITRGYSLTDPARAATSQKHVLAITNRGDASADDVIELARVIRDRVFAQWGITLEAEPRLIGCAL